jgi:predicted nucleic acid-binding protein
MARKVLDTNVLINFWHDKAGNTPPAAITKRRAAEWGRQLIELQGTDALLTPIYIEFVCGKGSAHEVQLAHAFLAGFEMVDGGKIRKEDWEHARRIAERVPRDGLRRQLVDCLIRAICNRLHLEFFTFEKRFPH